MTNVFIVDDHEIMRLMLRTVLEREDDFHVCGEAATGADALDALAALCDTEPDAAESDADDPDARPDVLLVDYSLPDTDGVALMQAVHARWPACCAVLLSGHSDRARVAAALEAGAAGYILKGTGREVPEALRHVRDGATYVSPGLAQ
jgi:DNA-binding NarL/FixJ family response regulator